MVMTPIPVYYPVNGDFIDTSKNASKRYAVLEKNSYGLYIAVVPPKEYPDFTNGDVANPAVYGLAFDFAELIARQAGSLSPVPQFAISSANLDLELMVVANSGFEGIFRNIRPLGGKEMRMFNSVLSRLVGSHYGVSLPSNPLEQRT